ncbi:MAG: cation transporter [Clostridia bacterium]|nr:cation transporter [Clostridia bacterium]
MKTAKSILIAFILNLSFSVFEFFGGILTGSVSIISDALHDTGDAISIGLSYFLEKKSKKQPDKSHTFGYARYSVLGSVITTLILISGSVAVIYNAVKRIINPVEIDYKGMIILAVVGVAVNLAAALFTHSHDSLNHKAVSLHMFEDVLGWLAVLVGAVIMKITDFSLIDPILSICVSVFILIHAVKHLIPALNIFLEKAPDSIDSDTVRRHVMSIEGVSDVSDIRVWSLDENTVCATMHIITDSDPSEIKSAVRRKLFNIGIYFTTLESETV